MQPRTAIAALWVAWAASWLLAALWSGRSEGRAGLGSEAAYRVPMIAGAALMFVPAHGYEGRWRLWHVGWHGAWLCVALIALGIAFAWWARLTLGRLWSASVTCKADHRVVDSGPYALVRHPIYTGMLLALLATAAAKGTLLGVVGFALLLLGVWTKARLEERWLSTELGAGAYADYRRRVPMLVPFWPVRG